MGLLNKWPGRISEDHPMHQNNFWPTYNVKYWMELFQAEIVFTLSYSFFSRFKAISAIPQL